MRELTVSILAILFFAGAAPAQKNIAPQSVGDDKAAYRTIKKLAENGDALSQNWLGQMYVDGSGVEKNLAEAIKWFEKSATQGYTPAHINLAWIYSEGIGIKKDLKKAASWYEKAAKLGDVKAETKLGALYLDGTGVKKDDNKALKLFESAAEKDHPMAQFYLALMYCNGRGVAADPTRCLVWMTLAARRGNTAAVKNAKFIQSKMHSPQIKVAFMNAAEWVIKKNSRSVVDYEELNRKHVLKKVAVEIIIASGKPPGSSEEQKQLLTDTVAALRREGWIGIVTKATDEQRNELDRLIKAKAGQKEIDKYIKEKIPGSQKAWLTAIVDYRNRTVTDSLVKNMLMTVAPRTDEEKEKAPVK